MTKKPKWQTVLESLMMGLPIHHQGYDWALSEDMEVLVKFADEDRWVRPLGDMSLGWFLRWCDTFPEEDLVVLRANLALNKEK